MSEEVTPRRGQDRRPARREQEYALKHLVSGDYVVGLEPQFGSGPEALPLTRVEAEQLIEWLGGLGALIALVPLANNTP